MCDHSGDCEIEYRAEGNFTQMSRIEGAFKLRELPQDVEAELFKEGGAAVFFLLSSAHRLLQDTTVDWSALERCAQRAYGRAWERMHCGDWKSVAGVWRQAFGITCVFKAQCLAHQGKLVESLKALDMCLMMAGPYAVSQVHAMITAVEDEMRNTEDVIPVEAKRIKLSPSPLPVSPAIQRAGLKYPVQRVNLPSLQAFRDQFVMTNTPVIITGGMDHWPAMGKIDPHRSWQTLDYFRKIAGYRTVPVEIGSSYLEDDWGQQLMTMNEFIDTFLDPPHATAAANRVGYLAQHHLFEQIPALGRDIMTPDYCTVERDEHEDYETDEDVAINAWFGPQGTVSPLHFDPKDNVLCQVVGAKYLRLYAPSESANLYPVEGLLSNTSQVNVESPDTEQFPLFSSAAYLECELHAGEMLFIPRGHWHFVRSLSTSFSVSFWF